jgi:polar amino acid transport system substrate-binding protein
MHNKRLLISFCLILFFAIFGAKAANKVLHKPLLVVTENWPPYNYIDSDNNIVGSATEVVKNTLNATNIDYSIHVYPWARAYQLALTQPNVAIYSIIKTPARTPLFHWLCPLIQVKYYVFKLTQRNDIHINNFNDLKRYKQGVSRSSFFYQILKQQGFVEGKNFHTTSNNITNLRELLHHRIDIISGTKEFIYAQLKKLNIASDKVEAIYEIKHQAIGDICLAISLKTPLQRVDKIKQAYQKLYSFKNN